LRDPDALGKTFDRPTAVRRATIAVLVLVVLDFALRSWVAMRPIAATDGLTTDDTFYCLHIARSIAAGHGPLYGLEPTNGFQPLYVFLIAPFYWAWPTDAAAPIHASLVLLAALDAAALWALTRLCRRLTTRPVVPVIVAACWVFDAYVARTAANGMETTTAVLLQILALDSLDRIVDSGVATPRDAARFGGLVGLAGLARLDSLFLGPIGLAYACLRVRAGALRVDVRARAVVACAGGFLAAYGAWIAYSAWYTGSVMPVSGRALRAMTAARDWPSALAGTRSMLTMSAGHHVALHPALVTICAAAGAAWIWISRRDGGRRSNAHRLIPCVAFAVALLVAYSTWIRAWWHLPRYVFPTTVAVYLVMAASIDAVLTSCSDALRRVVAGVCIAAPAAAAPFHRPFVSMYTSTAEESPGYVRIGLWAAEHLPRGARVGATQSGAIGYFAVQSTVVNLDGVVNAAALRAWEKGATIDYLRDNRVEYVLSVSTRGVFSPFSADGGPPPLEVVEKVPGVQTGGAWILFRVRPR
jgi:hypothetical protein